MSYISRQKRRNLHILTNYANDKRYMGPKNLLEPDNRCYFGLKFTYETIPNELIPFDYETFAAYPGQVEAVVTNLDTGCPEYLPVPRRDEKFLVLQATCAMPLLFPIFYLDNRPYLDGGASDAIPYDRAFRMGCERVVVILTRERSYRRKPELLPAINARYRAEFPNFCVPWRPGRSAITTAGSGCSAWRRRERCSSSPRKTPRASPARKRTWERS